MGRARLFTSTRTSIPRVVAKFEGRAGAWLEELPVPPVVDGRPVLGAGLADGVIVVVGRDSVGF